MTTVPKPKAAIVVESYSHDEWFSLFCATHEIAEWVKENLSQYGILEQDKHSWFEFTLKVNKHIYATVELVDYIKSVEFPAKDN